MLDFFYQFLWVRTTIVLELAWQEKKSVNALEQANSQALTYVQG